MNDAVSHDADAGSARREHRGGRDRRFFVGLARACAGALIFGLPMLMTMEMWEIGSYLDPWRMAALLLVAVPLLTGLSTISGFKPTETLRDDVADAFVAIAVAAAISAAVLAVFGVLTPGMPVNEAIGKVALQVFPAGVGAMLARDQISTGDDDQGRDHQPRSYGGELFLMAVGALFLGLNVAPTEEMVLLAYTMQPWQEVALALLSLALMQAFVYAVESAGGSRPRPGATFWGLFLHSAVAGYAVVLLIAFYLLWTFGRTDGTGVAATVSACVVLGFPCAIGAASARLIL